MPGSLQEVQKAQGSAQASLPAARGEMLSPGAVRLASSAVMTVGVADDTHYPKQLETINPCSSADELMGSGSVL